MRAPSRACSTPTLHPLCAERGPEGAFASASLHPGSTARASPRSPLVDPKQPERELPQDTQAAPAEDAAARDVAIFLDLVTRDGRLAVEVRAVQPLATGFFASPRATIYS